MSLKRSLGLKFSAELPRKASAVWINLELSQVSAYTSINQKYLNLSQTRLLNFFIENRIQLLFSLKNEIFRSDVSNPAQLFYIISELTLGSSLVTTFTVEVDLLSDNT